MFNSQWSRYGLRAKLIAVFVVIKVVPLLLIAWFGWDAAIRLAEEVAVRVEEVGATMRKTIRNAGDVAIGDSIVALDVRSRQAIETRTTDTALAVARFLYERDDDIRLARNLPRTEEAFRAFLDNRTGRLDLHGDWRMNPEGTAWTRVEPLAQPANAVGPGSTENAEDFHARPPAVVHGRVVRPLYHEMTFVDLQGRERIKVRSGQLGKEGLQDISSSAGTWWGAEHYFDQLKSLGPGDIWVGRVIGPQLATPLIGPYTRSRAEEKGLAFEPEKAAYAGKENPVGRHFQGLLRWASPVVENGRVIGYVTLALDHSHLMAFTDTVVPTEERTSDIADAGSGNYAFMWDPDGRNISHPRDYFIVGIDPATGRQAIPWLDRETRARWLESGQDFWTFAEGLTPYADQTNAKKAAIEQIALGQTGLDCRYLSFAPQCIGWMNLTAEGGSGSFAISWSGLRKLTTAAAIPYFTGPYGATKRGFGFVTIGANVDEFHEPADQSALRIETVLAQGNAMLSGNLDSLDLTIQQSLNRVWTELAGSTVILVILVIVIAFYLAAMLVRPIREIICGARKLQSGQLEERLPVRSRDELGEMAQSFNIMADRLQKTLADHARARQEAEASAVAKSQFLANMSHELRTPLNAILGFSDVVRTETLGPVQPEGYKAYAGHIHTAGSSLLRIVNDILEMAELDLGKLKLEIGPTNLKDVLDFVDQHLATKALHADVQLHVAANGLPPMETDAKVLRQILLNLATNAIIFNKPGGEARITATLDPGADRNPGADRERADWVTIRVTDTGIGMTEDQIILALEPFRQVKGAFNRDHEGTGLGLSLAKGMTDALGGSLTITSTPEEGTQVTVRLPVHHPIGQPAS
ncbi:MAG: sensor histidine kinase [Rhodospirillales bacterium]